MWVWAGLQILVVYGLQESASQWRWSQVRDWLQQRVPNTFVNDKINLSEGVYGLVPAASSPLAKNELLLQIPLEGLFLWHDCFPSDLPLPPSTLQYHLGSNFTRVQVLSAHTKLAMCLTVHQILGSNSSFFPWLQTLPSHVHNFYHIPLEEDIEVLRGTHTYSILRKDARVVEKDIDLLWPIMQEFMSDFRLNGSEINQTSFGKLFRRAGSLAQSRSFNLTSIQVLDNNNNNSNTSEAGAKPIYFPSLVPLLEMFNHAPTLFVNCRYRWKNQRMELLTTRDIRAGEELLLSYGLRSNAQLTTAYGFVLKEHPEDFVLTADLGAGAIEYNLQQMQGKGNNLCETMFFAPPSLYGWNSSSLSSLCPSSSSSSSSSFSSSSPSSEFSCLPSASSSSLSTETCVAELSHVISSSTVAKLQEDAQVRRNILKHLELGTTSILFPDTLLDSTVTSLRLSVLYPLSAFMVHRILASPHNQLHAIQENQVMKTLVVFCIDELSVRLHALGRSVNREGGVFDIIQRLLDEAQATITAQANDFILITALAKSELKVIHALCSAAHVSVQ